MEPPAIANVLKDPSILQQNPVLYVSPLRIVAPPGVPPYLPRSFDPFNSLKRFPPEFFTHNRDGTARTPASSAPPHPAAASQTCHSNGANGLTPEAANGSTSVKYSTAANAKFSNESTSFGTRSADFGVRSANCATGSANDDSNSEILGDHAQMGLGSVRNSPISPENGLLSGNRVLEGVDYCFQKAPLNTDHAGNDGTIETADTSFLPGNLSASAARATKTATMSRKTNSTGHMAEIGSISTENGHNSDFLSGHTKKKRKRESKPRKPRVKRAKMEETSSDVSPHKAVIKALRLYDALRRNLLVGEESKEKDAIKGSRPDLQAGSIINRKSLMVNRNKKHVGSVPGVEIGDQFFFRMELCCIGLHGPIQGGIDYLTVKESEHKVPVATSVISSGGYDATDNGDELVYTGQGGKSAQDGKSIEDQKLERGNLAMENSMKHQVPIRVTRGIRDSASPSSKTYTYDGLYKVEQCWSEKGKYGFEEFKFKLCRLPGQPDLGSASLKLSNSLKYRPSEREGLCLSDIAGGKEGLPICVVNTVDNLKTPPPFEYSTSLQYSQGAAYVEFGGTQGCDCTGVCIASDSCSCFVRNNYAFAYLRGGILVKERSVIYECGSNCQCSFICRNRLTQKALKFRPEVFKTEDRGWGLRSWDTIPAGSFICEFTGRFVQNAQLPQRRDFVVDLGRLPKSNPLWGDVSSLLDTQPSQATVNASIPEFAIDSSQIGNASRFINHSCSPNVLVQCILRDHQDTKRPHLMLFAMDNIPPFKELTRDYGSDLARSNSEEHGMQCLCKSEDCRGRLFQ